ncbi:MAG TPA: hypothetical protein PLW81_11275 [Thiobacillaceae bacterium]|nr:hypothetical protein [Thiobacillaceae bacterium]
MNLLKCKFPLVLLLCALGAPISASAEEARAEPQAAAPAADQPDRLELMQAMRERMHQMMRTQDPEERRKLMDEQMKSMASMMEMGPPGPGMGMMMGPGGGLGPMAMTPGGGQKCNTAKGPGMGMMSPSGDKPCKAGPGGHCRHGDGALDQRLDALEKRMDLMQAMLEYLSRR